MAEGSQILTTYYAKRIMGDTAAATATQALLQTGENIVADTWILHRSDRSTQLYGIKYKYGDTVETVNDGHDKIEFYGASTAVEANATPSAWAQLDTGDAYFMGSVGIGTDTLSYKLSVNGTSYFSDVVNIANQSISSTQGSGSLIIGSTSGKNISIDEDEIIARDYASNTVVASNLNLNVETASTTGHLSTITMGNSGDNSGYVSIQYTNDCTSTSTGALRVSGGLYVAKQIRTSDDLTIYTQFNRANVTGLSADATRKINFISGDNKTFARLAAEKIHTENLNKVYISIYNSNDTDTEKAFTLNAPPSNATNTNAYISWTDHYVGHEILPYTHDSYNIGNASYRWKYGYFTTNLFIGTTTYTNSSQGVVGTSIGAGSITLVGDTTPEINFKYNKSTSVTSYIKGIDGAVKIGPKLVVNSDDTTFTLNGRTAASSFTAAVYGNLFATNPIYSNTGFYVYRNSSGGGGIRIYQGDGADSQQQYGALYIDTLGATNAEGSTILLLGNEKKYIGDTKQDKNASGIIRLYNCNGGYGYFSGKYGTLSGTARSYIQTDYISSSTIFVRVGRLRTTAPDSSESGNSIVFVDNKTANDGLAAAESIGVITAFINSSSNHGLRLRVYNDANTGTQKSFSFINPSSTNGGITNKNGYIAWDNGYINNSIYPYTDGDQNIGSFAYRWLNVRLAGAVSYQTKTLTKGTQANASDSTYIDTFYSYEKEGTAEKNRIVDEFTEITKGDTPTVQHYIRTYSWKANSTARAILRLSATSDTTPVYSLYTNGTFTADGAIRTNGDHVTIYAASTTASNTPSKIAFINKDTTTTQEQNTAFISVYNTHAANNNGMNMVIQSAGNMFIGGGESPNGLYATLTTSTSENLYALADGDIFLESTAATLANRVGIKINSGNVIPTKAEDVNSNVQNLGATTSRWKTLYLGSGIYVGDDNYTAYNSAYNGTRIGIRSIFLQNQDASDNGYYIYGEQQSYARFYLERLGTTTTYGLARITLGNSLPQDTAKNAVGRILLYGREDDYMLIEPATLTSDIILSGTADTFTMPKLNITSTQDSGGTTDLSGDTRPALVIGTITDKHLEICKDEIMAKATKNTTNTLYLNNNGGMIYAGDTVKSHGHFKCDRTGYGLFLIDSASKEYAGIYDNGANLWIGATSSTGQHHKGKLLLSSGHNGTSGNASIYISIPTNGNASTTDTEYPLVYKDKAGSATKGIYTDANGKTAEMTYSLNATIPVGAKNVVPYYSAANTISTIGTANGALYATSANGNPAWGTLPTGQGGTGNTSYTANRLVWTETATKFTAGYHYASSTKIGICYTSEPSYNFAVSGTSYFNGNTTHNGIVYFANGTTYYIDNNAKSYFGETRVTYLNVNTVHQTTYRAYINGTLLVRGTSYINVGGDGVDITKSNNAAATNGITANTNRQLQWIDANGKYIGRVYARADTNGKCNIIIQAGNWYGDTPAQQAGGIGITLDKLGNCTYSVSGAANFRSAIGVGASGTHDDNYFATAWRNPSTSGQLMGISVNTTTHHADNSAYNNHSLLLGVTTTGLFLWDSTGSTTVWSSSRWLEKAGGTMTGTLTLHDSGSALVWKGGSNITCTPTANNQEYSFDLGNAYTGTYWHVWSGKNNKSILVCYNDNMNVSVPNGTLSANAFSGPLTGNVTGSCSGYSTYIFKRTSLTKGTNPSSTSWVWSCFGYQTGSGTAVADRVAGGVECCVTDAGTSTLYLRAYKYASGSSDTNTISITCAKDGTCTYGVSSPANFRSAISAAADNHTHGWANLTDNANSLSAGTSDLCDGAEILTSYASSNGFADTNAKGKVYRRNVTTMYNYIKSKASGSWGISVTGSAGSVAWANTGHPSTFPPSSHDHTRCGTTATWLYFNNSNEVNFGGTSTATTIYFGYRATDSRPMPTAYSFGKSGAYATIYCSSVNTDAVSALDGNGLLCYKPASWSWVSDSQWGVGATNCQGVIRSSNSHLVHAKAGTNYNILDASNYTSYTVKKDGTGASGSWGISITGNAAAVSWQSTADCSTANNGGTNVDRVCVWSGEKNGNGIMRLRTYIYGVDSGDNKGDVLGQFVVRNYNSSASTPGWGGWGGISIYAKKDGTFTYGVSSSANFRSAIGVGASGTHADNYYVYASGETRNFTTTGNVYAHRVWANQGTEETRLAVDHTTAGNLYLYSNGTNKGLYSGSGYKTGAIIKIDGSTVGFYGELSGNATGVSTSGNAVLRTTNSSTYAQLQTATRVLRLQADGNLVVYEGSTPKWSAGTGSSRLIKQNIYTISDSEINKFMKIRPVSFIYRPEMGYEDILRYGVIAEELLLVYPNLVDIPNNYSNETFDIKKGMEQPLITVKYDQFIPLLIKMVQNQQREIEQLRNQINERD